MISSKSKILIVDDQPANIKVIIAMLDDDYDLSVAKNGGECLQAVADNPPDLILLDVMMPVMDGYETCRKLQANHQTKHIPVIFMTAKSEEEDEEHGLELGAIDYIRKPFKLQIAKSRIDNQLELQKYRTELEHMVEEQAEQLIHADRLATMGTFAAGVAHEVNNPTSFIRGNIQALQLFWNLARPILFKHQSDDPTGKVALMIDDIENIFLGILKGTKRISSIVDSLKTYSRRGDKDPKEEIFISEPINEAVAILKNRITNKIQIDVNVADDVCVIGNSQKLSQVFINLINNAIDACYGQNGKIEVFAESIADNVLISITDNGDGMSQEVQDKIFMPFFTTKDKANGTGLGMAIIDRIIQEHKGSIDVTSKPNQGTSFIISLPARQSSQNRATP